ncbi:MAG TPA: hypothetical protein VME40_14470 [Caulobacteraceae bacterium]|nr:hypothetical protein [Caulobacteraceae bacterium]
MISLIVNAGEDHKTLSRLLTALVPAAAEGLIREVAVLGALGRSADVADDAGADLYEAGAFAEALERTRGPWVAGLPMAASFAPAWIEILSAHLAREPAEPARLVSARAWPPLPGGPEGWLVPKAQAPSAATAEEDLQRLARRSGGRLRILSRS